MIKGGHGPTYIVKVMGQHKSYLTVIVVHSTNVCLYMYMYMYMYTNVHNSYLTVIVVYEMHKSNAPQSLSDKYLVGP